MKTFSLRFSISTLGLAATLALLTPALRAQSAPMSSPTAPMSTEAAASMSEDIEGLKREVGQLSLHVESLQQENDEMKKRIPTSEEIKSLVENQVAASRAEINKDITRDLAQANEDTRKQILADVAKQLETLANDTNAQFEKLRKYMGGASVSVAHPASVTSTPAPKFDKGIDYVVKHGDTLAKICIANHVSSRDLILANPQLNGNGNLIREGEHLFIPQKDGAPASAASTEAATSTGAVLNFEKPQ